jgi:hypothetical protein
MDAVTISALWLPILLSAVVVWILSAVFWMVSPHHKKDFQKLPGEDAVLNALRSNPLSPGQYWIPYADPPEMKDPAVIEKYEQGPVGILTVMKSGVPAMGKNVALSLVYYVIVGVFVAYVTSRHLGAGAEYIAAFRLASVVAFLAYGMGVVPDAIWFGRPWSSSLKVLFDALVYGLFTGGVFGWLWPGA